ncbi:alpha/beta hydrolase [Luteibacter aegosomatissinici]|uniref:alpha/beta hydrolase n=1 Tax=Luteibacter aegosomatissinici TaxID=2911539 RepID=UPI001FF75A68|nr:alpha/beta hydrolase-fold protein [Luteibacter aegosomatissinici]UPG92780.1 alpha/beta hydrolase-fold protein [Luteibacter aegosomatissinici]
MNPIVSIAFSISAIIAPLTNAGEVSLPPAEVHHTQQFDFVSSATHESYRVKVSIPHGHAPRGGFPVIYVLDGDLLFGTFAEAAGNEGKAAERAPAVVVGIEGGEGKKGADRTYDFTPKDLTPYEKQVVVDLGPNPRFGGYDAFFRAITDEIKPRVGRLVPVDVAHQSIVGWSLGGQFVVHTMLTHPEAFTNYVALSPALWRSGRAVFGEIDGFERTITSSRRTVNLFVGVGSLEEELSPGMLKWDIDQTRFAAEMKYARMVGNVRDLDAALAPFFRSEGMAMESHIYLGDTHNTVVWTAVNPVLRFLLDTDHPK